MNEPTEAKNDPFYSSKFALDWAEDHLVEFDREIEAFFVPENYSTPVELDADGTHKLLKFKLAKPMPRAIQGHILDIVHNLRSALDLAISSIATLNRTSSENCYFPISNSAEWMEASLNKKLKGLIPQEIADVVRSFKPYKGANDLIWAMHKLCNTNKHGIIRPFPFKANRAVISGTSQGAGFQIPINPPWDSSKNEMVLVRAEADAKFTMDFDYSFLIVFDGVEWIDGKPVTSIVEDFLDEVHNIVATLETETRRIGLI